MEPEDKMTNEFEKLIKYATEALVLLDEYIGDSDPSVTMMKSYLTI